MHCTNLYSLMQGYICTFNKSSNALILKLEIVALLQCSPWMSQYTEYAYYYFIPNMQKYNYSCKCLLIAVHV